MLAIAIKLTVAIMLTIAIVLTIAIRPTIIIKLTIVTMLTIVFELTITTEKLKIYFEGYKFDAIAIHWPTVLLSYYHFLRVHTFVEVVVVIEPVNY